MASSDVTYSTPIMNETQSKMDPAEFKLYRRRWLVVGSYFMFMLLQSISWMSVSVLTYDIMQGFGIGLTEVNLAITLVAITQIPAYVLAVWLYSNAELRTVQMISCLMTFVGGWVRMLVVRNANFWWVVAGSAIIGTGSPFQVGGISVLANYWCGDKERALATAIMTAANPVGMLCSFALSGFYGARMTRQEQGLNTAEANQVIRDNIYSLFLV